MADTESDQSKTLNIAQRLIDPAVVIATMVASLYFSGWTYYCAYLLRLGLDPAGMGLTNLTIGVEGAGAILTTTGAWLMAIFPMLLVGITVLLLAQGLRRWRPTSDGVARVDLLASFMVRAGFLALAILIILASGTIAGRQRAHDQLATVKRGSGWDYHLKTGVVRGVPIAQANDRIWLLTKSGVQPLKIDDVQNIDGPLFAKVSLDD